MQDGVTIREATDDDLDAILEVATVALGWDPDDPNEAFFRWKHLDNPAGRARQHTRRVRFGPASMLADSLPAARLTQKVTCAPA